MRGLPRLIAEAAGAGASLRGGRGLDRADADHGGADDIKKGIIIDTVRATTSHNLPPFVIFFRSLSSPGKRNANSNIS